MRDFGLPTDHWLRAMKHVQTLVTGPPLDPTLRVTLHFHPDRAVGAQSLLEHLVTDGVYRSQFETLTSNGGLTAHQGGDRWRWEHQLFGGAYDQAPAEARPTYGSLNHRHRCAGGSIRFGSAHLRLGGHTLQRTTFCYPDSVFDPTAFGTATHMPLIPLADSDDRDLLDDYIEAHLHGPLRLEQDVECVVLDPAYRGTEIEAAAAALPCPTEWHHGFRIHVDELDQHTDYRGAAIVAAGRDLAVDGWLDPPIIGQAAAHQRYDLQTVKRLWHCLARFGHPSADTGSPKGE